jgi:L-alanine-DL-glutamate epimerase-like enolase superfamily enzyme
MEPFRLDYRAERLPLAAPFRISGFVFDHSEVVTVTLRQGAFSGRGEAAGVYYLDDDVRAITTLLERKRDAIEGCTGREELRSILPPGGARNAVDCAMWEVEARRSATPVWELAGLDPPRPLLTTMTVGVDAPERMVSAALAYKGARAIKVKLQGCLEADVNRVQAVRAACPDVWLGVDANQGFSVDDLPELVRAMQELGVQVIEQPLARGREADLDGFKTAIPLAADESALDLEDVEHLPGRFDIVNIKLDKCGGLTEALMIAERARALGLGVMVGNMVGTSLAMAPAFMVGQLCDVVDLDGPLFLKDERGPRVAYRDGLIHLPDDLWGSEARS